MRGCVLLNLLTLLNQISQHNTTQNTINKFTGMIYPGLLTCFIKCHLGLIHL